MSLPYLSRGLIHCGVRWKTVDLVGDGRDRGEQLHAGGAVADDGDALAGEVEVLGPAGRVHDQPLEELLALELSGTSGW